MSTDFSSTQQIPRPSYPKVSLARKAAMALVSVLVSSTLLGGMLSMFELRSEQALTARAGVETAPSTAALAVRDVERARRG